MKAVSVGDLSRFSGMRAANAGLRKDIQRLSKEVTTGVRTDLPKHLGGELSQLVRIETELRAADTYRVVQTEAGSIANAMQASFSTLQEIAEEMATTTLSANSLATGYSLKMAARDAKAQLERVVDALNITVGGRFLFSGSKVSTPSLASAEELILQAEEALKGSGSAAEALQRLQNWIDAEPGSGGFTDRAYQGSGSPSSSFNISGSTTVSFTQTAQHPAIRKVLSGLLIGAVVDGGLFENNFTEQSSLMKSAGDLLLEGDTLLGLARAEIGADQAKIEASTAELSAKVTNLGLQRSRLIGADSYESGSQLVQAQSQLEALLSLTARLSRLSLANYL
ncbi:flagellin [Paracoccus sediminicola]|uniref:flagellin n=1 Tax=Paracoccus sediminicola TaxID=3017783 RepID=UPI0022F0B4D3|nr:flagellin [Paracoccus sediminicola]WBU58418.1 flagellin [Paracoccus sediminicola]